MPDPDPKPLFRVVDAETGEPVIAVPLQCDYMIDNEGDLWEVVDDDVHDTPYREIRLSNYRVEWLLDPTTGRPPRRFNV